MNKQIILTSLLVMVYTPLSLVAQESPNTISHDFLERVCPLHAMREQEKDDQQAGTASTPQTSAKPEKKDDDTESARRILKYFAQVVAHFFSLLKDPKNPVVVQPHLNGMFSGMISIFMEAFKKDRNTQPSQMSEHHAHLVRKLHEKVNITLLHKA